MGATSNLQNETALSNNPKASNTTRQYEASNKGYTSSLAHSRAFGESTKNKVAGFRKMALLDQAPIMNPNSPKLDA
jgi:hypothetical protein